VHNATVAYAQETGVTPTPSVPAPAPAPSAAPAVTAQPATPAPEPDKPAPSHDSLDQLKSQLKELAERKDLISAAAKETAVKADELPAGGTQEVQALRAEVATLRKEVSRLQETVDAALAYLVGELGDENKRLKRDIALPPGESSAPAQETVSPDAPAPETPQPESAPLPKVDYGELGYLSVKEWGRTPAQAKEVGPNVSSLRGMICAVPTGATDEELKAVAKKLRATCAGFDNVNIDVFDDEAAARDFADHNVRSTPHYVMSIIRHKQAGKDATILVRPNGTREVSVDQ